MPPCATRHHAAEPLTGSPYQLLDPHNSWVTRVVQQVVPAVNCCQNSIDITRGIFELKSPALCVPETKPVLPHSSVVPHTNVCNAKIENLLIQETGYT